MRVLIEVPGRPVPKARMTQKSKWTKRAKKCLDYQKQVAWAAKIKKEKFEGPVKLTARFYFKDRKHGDLSNYIKSVEDGLQHGQIVENDKQVRRYGEGTGIYFDDEERAEIVLESIEEVKSS